jgi:dihydroneopterin aldolase
MNRVELVDMHFYAYHGCFEEEQIIGNNFLVNF